MKTAFPHQFITKAFAHLAIIARHNLLEAESHGLLLDIDQRRGLITFVNGEKLKVRIFLSRAAKARNKLTRSGRHIKIVFWPINSGIKKNRVIPIMETYKLTLIRITRAFGWLPMVIIFIH